MHVAGVRKRFGWQVVVVCFLDHSLIPARGSVLREGWLVPVLKTFNWVNTEIDLLEVVHWISNCFLDSVKNKR